MLRAITCEESIKFMYTTVTRCVLVYYLYRTGKYLCMNNYMVTGAALLVVTCGLLIIPLEFATVSDTELDSNQIAGDNLNEHIVKFSIIEITDDNCNSVQYDIKEILESSNPIVVVDGDLNKANLSELGCCYSDDCKYTAMFFDKEKGTTHCYSTDCSRDELESELEEWMGYIEHLETETPPSYTITRSNSITEGNIQTTNLYYYLGSNQTARYYADQYIIRSESLLNDWKTADFWVESQVDSENSMITLLDSAPDDNHIMQQTTVSISFGVSGINGSVGWTFVTPVTLIDDQSMGNHYKIWFDVDEDQANSTEKVRPGCLLEIGSNSIFEIEETMRVQFEGPYAHHFWPWDPTTIQRSVSITTHLNVP